MTSDKRFEVKVYLTPEERQRLDQEALNLRMTRGQLIRDRALGNVEVVPTINVRTYSKAVSNAARVCSGIPRTQLEALVASVVTTIAQPN